MAQVKFYRGVKANYNASTHSNGIFFATDTHEVILNSVAYGFSTTNADILTALNEHAITNVELVTPAGTAESPSTPTLKVTCNQSGAEHDHVFALPLVSATSNGLMTPALKKQVEDNAAAITAINNNLGEGGSVSTQITNAIESLDVAKVGATGEVITSIEQVDGKIVATAGKPDAANVTYTPDGGEATTVDATLNEVSTTIATNANAAKVTISASDADDVAKKYVFTQNGKEIGTINIPKDLVVSSGEVIVATNEPSLTAGDKYIKLTIANQEAPLYIPVKDLVDVYTAGNGISVSELNAIAIELASDSESFLAVGSTGLKLSGVQAAINSAKKEVKDVVDNVVTAVGLKADGTLKAAFAGEYSKNSADVVSALNAIEAQVKKTADDVSALTGGESGSISDLIDDAVSAVEAHTINGKALSTNPVINGADIALTGYTAPTGGSIAATDTINAAINKLDDALVWHEA